jgi:sarcosine oxidase, subunit gamma
MRSRVLDPCSIVRVQSWDVAATPPSGTHQVVGVAWPREVGAVASGLDEILCIGPTEWLVMGADLKLGELRTALSESPFRATDVSHALARIELEGPEVRESLLKGCSLDLHPDHFPPNRCARTRFAGLPTVLRSWGPSKFEGIVPSSYRAYLLAWLADLSDPV